tara:strand:- start:9511 stop:10611 length:1101 start_codon:yes stop_codon:yes gene_type:complete
MFIRKNNNRENNHYMELALVHASKTLGNTKKNPSVGCVIVKDGVLISASSTGINGTPHAEHNAIKNCKSKVKGSTLYSTLEPCSNYGKTPPCVNLIVKRKFKKVFFSLKDPDFRSFDKSKIKFKKNKIIVHKGLNLNHVNNFYRSYIKSKKNDFPFVTCKIALSKDYFLKHKKNLWITNYYSRRRVHIMRSEHDCILTSYKTISDDNSTLSCRIEGLKDFSPHRIILDKNLSISLSSNIIKTSKKIKTLIFFNKLKKKKIKILKRNKIKLVKMNLINHNFDLREIIKKVKSMGYSRVFLECGLNLTENFLKNKLIDDLYIFISSKKIGKNGKLNFKFKINNYLKNKKFIHENVNLFGDKLLFYKIK